MKEQELLNLLERVRCGGVSPEEAAKQILGRLLLKPPRPLPPGRP